MQLKKFSDFNNHNYEKLGLNILNRQNLGENVKRTVKNYRNKKS